MQDFKHGVPDLSDDQPMVKLLIVHRDTEDVGRFSTALLALLLVGISSLVCKFCRTLRVELHWPGPGPRVASPIRIFRGPFLGEDFWDELSERNDSTL